MGAHFQKDAPIAISEMNMKKIFENCSASSKQVERIAAAYAAYISAIAANGTRRGGESAATVEAMYKARGIYIDELAKGHLVTPEMFAEIDTHGRTDIASALWGICNEDARKLLLKDRHHFVCSSAVLSSSDNVILFTGSQAFNPAHEYIGGEVNLQFWTNCPGRKVRVVYDMTEKRFVFLKGRYLSHFNSLSGTDTSCLNEFLQEQEASRFLEDCGCSVIEAFPAWMS